MLQSMRATAHSDALGRKSADPARTAMRASGSPLSGAYAGNQALLGQLSRSALRVQTALRIGSVNDPLETEADRVAAQVMRMSAPPAAHAAAPGTLQRKCSACEGGDSKCSACEHEDEEKKVQTKRGGSGDSASATTQADAPPIVHEALRSPGQPLDPATRSFFEERFAYDFSPVRIHTGPTAARSAESIGALAYTLGPNIAFARGQYRPDTPQSRALIAHELAHVVQQRGGAEAAVQRAADSTQAPQMLSCPTAADSPPPATDFLLFPNDSSTITVAQKAQIAAFADWWKSAGQGATARVDGYASEPGTDRLNWALSCDRAVTVKNELMSPTDGRTPAVPEGSIEVFMHGETPEFGSEAQNRRVSLSLSGAGAVQPDPAKVDPAKLSDPPDRNDVQAAACAHNADCSNEYCLPFPTRKEALDDRAAHSGFVLNRISGLNAHARPLFDKFVFSPGPAGDISAQFEQDFSKDAVTLAMTKLLVHMLDEDFKIHPPSIPPRAASVDVDINAALTKVKTDEVLDREMVFSDPFSVGGLIAGGVGKTQVSCKVGANTAGAQDDARQVQGTVNVIKNPDGTYLLTPALTFTVIDTLDFCPGNCGGILASVLTEPLSRWEASFISGDVPFTVKFPGAALVGAYDSEE
jgi:outer membrane protein OmpA-like peptidoglycan-associated protein